MSILTYIESKDYKAKKNSFEVISYARALADQLSTDLVILCFNIKNINELSNYSSDIFSKF